MHLLHNTAKITWEDVRAIRSRAAAGETLASLAGLYGLSAGHVSDIVHFRKWAEDTPTRTHPIAMNERRRILAYMLDHAARVARAETRGRLTQKDRKLIVRHIEVVVGDVEAGLHREDSDGR